MIDFNQQFCTYKTTHESGFYYLGKAQTDNVLSGKYKGSGIRFFLARTQPGFEDATWTTTILHTFETEAEAYAAEEILVPIELLADPYCLNMHRGGTTGKYATHGALRKKILREKRDALRQIRAERAKLKKQKEQDKIKKLKQKLKDKNGQTK